MRSSRTDAGTLLARIAAAPNLAQVVQHMRPEVLHGVIRTCGLEACGDLVALATPEQLRSVLDVDLWRADRTGGDELLDAGRFGTWLGVLVDHDPAAAAQTLAAMDPDLLIAALSPHVRVFDLGAVATAWVDGEEFTPDRALDDGLRCELGGYVIAARATGAWDAIVAALASLSADHGECFHRVMRGCRRLSNSAPEIDGLDDLLGAPGQAAFDVAVARERRRDEQGYLSPAEARAFLELARARVAPHDAAQGDAISAAYLRTLREAAPAQQDDSPRLLPEAPPIDPQAARTVAEIVDTLMDAGVLAGPAPLLLESGREDAPGLSRLRWHLQCARERDAGAYERRSQELAYLANALVAGCSRPLSSHEGSRAAAAVCNLGLEHWASGAALADALLVDQDLIAVFRVGWATLYDEVVLASAAALVRILADIRGGDTQTQAEIRRLRFALDRHVRAGTPWHARDHLEVLASLDLVAWTGLLGVIDELPVLPDAIGRRGAGTLSVSASAFEFISERRQIAMIRSFMEELPAMLR